MEPGPYSKVNVRPVSMSDYVSILRYSKVARMPIIIQQLSVLLVDRIACKGRSLGH